MTDVKKEYGGALYLLSEDENLSDQFLDQLGLLKSLFSENAAYGRLLESPTLAIPEKISILDEAFAGNVHPYVLNFLKILTENGYIASFSDCCDEFEQRFNADRNICVAKITSAAPLSEEQKEKLRDKLEKSVGKKVKMHCAVDPSLIGGVRAELDGKLIDGTVKNKIDLIRDNLKKTVI